MYEYIIINDDFKDVNNSTDHIIGSMRHLILNITNIDDKILTNNLKYFLLKYKNNHGNTSGALNDFTNLQNRKGTSNW